MKTRITALLIILVLIALVYSIVPKDFLTYKSILSRKKSLTPSPQIQSNSDIMKIILKLNPKSGGDPGEATFTKDDKETDVILLVPNFEKGVDQSAYIAKGACDKLGGSFFPLSNVVEGKSTTRLNFSTKYLWQNLPLSVVVAKTFDGKANISYCGDILIK